MRIRICFKVNGLAEDENGNPAAAGLCIDLGESDKDIEYEKLTAAVNKEGVLKMACLDGTVKPEDMEFITPEEYDKEYGDHA